MTAPIYATHFDGARHFAGGLSVAKAQRGKVLPGHRLYGCAEAPLLAVFQTL